METTLQRRINLDSLYNEYTFFHGRFMETGNKVDFRRMSEEFGRYTFLQLNPSLTNSKEWDKTQ